MQRIKECMISDWVTVIFVLVGWGLPSNVSSCFKLIGSAVWKFFHWSSRTSQPVHTNKVITLKYLKRLLVIIYSSLVIHAAKTGREAWTLENFANWFGPGFYQSSYRAILWRAIIQILSAFLFCMYLVRVIQKARSAFNLEIPPLFKQFFRRVLSITYESYFNIKMPIRLANKMSKVALGSVRQKLDNWKFNAIRSHFLHFVRTFVISQSLS